MPAPGTIHQNCVVRKQACGRIFSGARIAFVATPAADSVALELDIIKSVVKEFGLEPYVAIEQFDPAQDIFCQKICTKIIESQFCIVLLTDPLIDERPMPNPNVYYEYGLMTGFGKTIVPLQREAHRLAFNVQSLDTIKYSPRNLRSRLAEAVALVLSPKAVPEYFDRVRGKKTLIKLAMQFLELAGHCSE